MSVHCIIFFNFSVCFKFFIIKFGNHDKKRTATRDARAVSHNENILEANRRGLKKAAAEGNRYQMPETNSDY